MIFRVMLISLITNIILSFVKIFFGILGNCKTLIANGIHSFSDMATDVIALIGIKFSSLPPDLEHPYGHGKYEYVTSILMSIIIIVLSIMIFFNSITSSLKIPSTYIILVLFFSLIIKLILADYILKKGKSNNNYILITSGVESKYEVLSTFISLILVIISSFGQFVPILKYIDIIGGIFISVLVFKIGIMFFIENVKSVIEEVESNRKINYYIKSKVLNILNGLEIKEFRLIKYGAYYKLELVLYCKNNLKLKRVCEMEKMLENELLKEENIKFVNIKFCV